MFVSYPSCLILQHVSTVMLVFFYNEVMYVSLASHVSTAMFVYFYNGNASGYVASHDTGHRRGVTSPWARLYVFIYIYDLPQSLKVVLKERKAEDNFIY